MEGVELGFTKIQVIEELREPPDREAPEWTFDDLGIEVEFDALVPARVSWIMVFDPYSGTTDLGIGLGATDSEVEGVYGDDYMYLELDFGNYMYEYVSLGIIFGFNSSDVCVEIGIYSP